MASVSIWSANAPYLRATINWDGTSLTNIQQEPQTFVINGISYTRYIPAFAINPSVSSNINGFITNLTQPNQTFNGSNQNLNLQNLSLGGIFTFDTDLTNLNSLNSLTLGGYYNSITQSTQTIIGPLINDPINISSFTTIMPNTTSNHGVTFTNNTVDCSNFNPTWNTKSTTFTFTKNQQTTPLLINTGHRFNTITITDNNSLNTLTLNNMQYLTGNCNLNNNALSSVYINGLNFNTVSGDLHINLSNNVFTEFNSSFIPNFPTTQSVSINLSANRIFNFDFEFTGPNMNILNLSSQIPVYQYLTTITDSSVQSTNFKQFNFQYNNITQCPILPTTMTHLFLDGNPIVATGVNSGELVRPNFSPIMQVFSIIKPVAQTTPANMSMWNPNPATIPSGNQHTRLQDITTWTRFSMTSQGLPEWTHQFNNNITSILSKIELQRNSLTTVDMSLIGGFSEVDISIQGPLFTKLTTITNLSNVTKTRILNISVNQAITSSSSIIPDVDSWPNSLYSISMSRCTGLVSWTKSFAGFNASNFGNLNLNFNGSGLNQTSVNFIINDLIKNTTLTNGTLNFSAPSPTLSYNYPNLELSTVTPDTLECLTCLTTPTNQACNPTLNSGSNLTSMGRGFTVRLIQV